MEAAEPLPAVDPWDRVEGVDAGQGADLMAAALERSALLLALWALQVPMMEVAEVAEVPVAQR